MSAYLVDTGPLVAVLDKDDAAHDECSHILSRLTAPLITSWPVITEASYLLAYSHVAQDGLLEMLQCGGVAVASLGLDDVPYLRSLMKKYRDTPMDLADATLVRLAEKERLSRVFTLDADFQVYRIGRSTRFTILPS